MLHERSSGGLATRLNAVRARVDSVYRGFCAEASRWNQGSNMSMSSTLGISEHKLMDSSILSVSF